MVKTAVSSNSLASKIKVGEVGIIPTDTVYGIVCLASNEKSAGRLYGLKKRETKPGTIIAASVEQLIALGVKARYLKAVEQFWPNPISIIIPVGSQLTYLHRGLQSLAFRVVADKEISKLLKKTGPLLTTSANPPDLDPASNLAQARKYFDSKVDFYVDGGDLSYRKPSTIIRIIDDAVEVVREGAVSIDENGRIFSK